MSSSILPLRGERPARVTMAAVSLTAALTLSAASLAVNQLVMHGSGIGPGPFIGIVSLVVQALMIVLVAQGNSIARILVLLFFALAASPLAIVPRLFTEGSAVSAISLVLGFILKGAATYLLFTGDSRAWFRSSAHPA